jgi:hypothetical protein
MSIHFTSIERVTYAGDYARRAREEAFLTSFKPVKSSEDQLRDAHYWASRTLAERVIASWELADKFQSRRKQEAKQQTEIHPHPGVDGDS